MGHTQRIWGRLINKLRSQFIIGIIAAVPIAVTILALVWLFNTIDNILQPVIRYIWGRPITGAGFGITIILIYLIGVIASNVVGKRLIHYAESILPSMPVVRQLYHGTKEVLESFSAPDKSGFLQVVLAEFPKKDMRAIGFVTHESYDKSGKKLLNVLIPTAPNPTTGFLQIVREEEVIRTDISIENAVKMVISAGRVSPEEITARLSEGS